MPHDRRRRVPKSISGHRPLAWPGVTYTLVQRLGRGGMGVVDLAVDAHGRPVAVKRLALHGSMYEMHRARQPRPA